MLCVGMIHGDLSEYNVLVDAHGPVIIDLPQAVSAAGNNHARAMLLRDVNKLRSALAFFAPELDMLHYGEEMWALFEEGELQPDTALTGQFDFSTHEADVDAVLDVDRGCAAGGGDSAAGAGSCGECGLIGSRPDQERVHHHWRAARTSIVPNFFGKKI